jgi:hypothetical protein
MAALTAAERVSEAALSGGRRAASLLLEGLLGVGGLLRGRGDGEVRPRAISPGFPRSAATDPHRPAPTHTNPHRPVPRTPQAEEPPSSAALWKRHRPAPTRTDPHPAHLPARSASRAADPSGRSTERSWHATLAFARRWQRLRPTSSLDSLRSGRWARAAWAAWAAARWAAARWAKVWRTMAARTAAQRARHAPVPPPEAWPDAPPSPEALPACRSWTPSRWSARRCGHALNPRHPLPSATQS